MNDKSIGSSSRGEGQYPPSLLGERRLLLELCDGSRDPSASGIAIRHQQDCWYNLLHLAQKNRVGALVWRRLREVGSAVDVPDETMAALKSTYQQNLMRCTRVLAELGTILAPFQKAGIPVLILRGPALGQVVYGDPALRPFTDLDLLVRREDVPAGRNCLESVNCALASSRLCPDYFEKYHLHLTYSHRPSGIAVELHWALDHMYTPFAISYEDILRRRRSVAIGDVQADVPCPEDDLLCNIVHLAKHAYFLPFLSDDPRLEERILDSGDLLLFCDILREVRHHGVSLDWDQILERSRAWAIEREVSASLRAVNRLFGAAIPDDELGRLSAPRVSSLEALAFRWLSPRDEDQAAGQSTVRRRLAAQDPRAVFRPIRILDLCRYIFPGAPFLLHRYRCRSAGGLAWRRLTHPPGAVLQLLINGIEWFRCSRRQARPADPARPNCSSWSRR